MQNGVLKIMFLIINLETGSRVDMIISLKEENDSVGIHNLFRLIVTQKQCLISWFYQFPLFICVFKEMIVMFWKSVTMISSFYFGHSKEGRKRCSRCFQWWEKFYDNCERSFFQRQQQINFQLLFDGIVSSVKIYWVNWIVQWWFISFEWNRGYSCDISAWNLRITL